MIADLLLTRSTRRSTIIKVKLLFNGSTLERMEKEHLTKLAPASQGGALYSIILLPLRIKGCKSTSRSSKAVRLWNLKHPILKAFSKHPVCSFIFILHLSRLGGGHERSKDEDKALLGDEERYSSAHECVNSRVCRLSPRGASRPWLNRPTLKMEKCK